MIDHITLGVADFARSTAFYDLVLAPLGATQLVEFADDRSDEMSVAGYGSDRPGLWLAGERATRGPVHFALQASCRPDVDAFHAAALEAGGTNNGAPGVRPHYHANYYAAFVLDPDGRNIEAVCHTAEV